MKGDDAHTQRAAPPILPALPLKHSIQKTKIMEPGPFMANRWGKMEAVTEFIFSHSKITAAMKLKDICSLKEKL